MEIDIPANVPGIRHATTPKKFRFDNIKPNKANMGLYGRFLWD